MNKVDSFYIVDRRWTIKYHDGSEVEYDESPIECEYIGESMTLEPLDISPDEYCYEAWWNFKNGLCPIRIKGKWGFVNSNFTIAIRPQFDFVGEVLSQKRACWRPEEFIHNVVWDCGICKVIFEGRELAINEKGEFLSTDNSKQTLSTNNVSEFINRFRERGNISFLGMRDTAISMLPSDRMVLDKLYNDLKRGTGILDDEVHLNMYLRCFGKMHKAKLDSAFACIPAATDLFSNEIEIYDWGCGQGIATICLLDYLKANHINYDIKSIHLVEPSAAAVKRACDVIECMDADISVATTTKVFDKLQQADFTPSEAIKLHLFSNILDVDSFDLARFIHLFQQCFSGTNYFVCVGPYYSNNRRVDEFVAATAPDAVFAVMNREKGAWLKEWTISMRVFLKEFVHVEPIKDIRKRIEESHKQDQFFAGYILDAISEELTNSDKVQEAEALYNSLCAFDVKSNVSLDGRYINDNSELAVLSNIISRGLPTKAPIDIENFFSDIFHISNKPPKDSVLDYHSTHSITAEAIFEALHVIDPRFDVEYYNGDMLESSFERQFVSNYLKGSQGEYLCQVLEPQRSLSSIVTIPDRTFSRDQRVDFALEIPYGEGRTGFIVELDGHPYHSNIFQRLRDEQRDKSSLMSGWDTYRIEHLTDNSFINGWEKETIVNQFLSTLKNNYTKTISGEWSKTLEVVLSPLAIARVELLLLEAMMSGHLKMDAESWNILVVERDVPCAAIALDDLKTKLQKIYDLSEKQVHLPTTSLKIVSTKEFKDSDLHLSLKPSIEVPKDRFDLCIDIAILLKDGIDALPLPIDADVVYITRTSHYKKKDRSVCTAENIQYPALVKKDTSGLFVSITDREETLTYFLQEIFRKPNFRPGQLPILSHALADKTTIGLLPTGGGKSLTYQLSCMLQPGVSIIVDPLVSLMVDQVRGMRDVRIDACDCVNSTMSGAAKTHKLNLLQKGAVQFMLLSPERFMMENFRESLITMTEKNHVHFAYGVIDEVHCVSEWGHDFRTSYLHLGRNMINFMRTKSERPLAIMGLTATASFDVLADVERELTLGGNLAIDSDAIVRPENDERKELTYRIIEVHSDYDKLRDSNDPNVLNANIDRELQNIVADTKKKKLVELIGNVPQDIETINEASIDSPCRIADFSTEAFFLPSSEKKYDNAGIVFCPHAHGSLGVVSSRHGNHPGISSSLLSEAKYLKIGTFIGGDKPSGDMRLFNDNEQNLMVATKAFGMGIDKPNIRFTVNFNHPSSIESFVQEAGRGGRDRKNAIAYILFDPTEYVHLTADKINDIRYVMGKEKDPTWLEHYLNKFILFDDFLNVCIQNNCSEEDSRSIINILRDRDFIENIDKNIDMWFHNNSFRGLYKEKVILWEMTDRLMNVKPNHLRAIQGRLRDELGNEDLLLRVNVATNSITIVSEEENEKQYGYIYLSDLQANYRYTNFTYNVCKVISEALISILSEYEDHSARALLRPIDGEDDIMEGIYAAMSKADKDGYVFVTVSWENNFQQDADGFERSIKAEIERIAVQKQWKNIDEDHYGKLKLNKVGDFDSLIAQIAKCSDDSSWLRCHGDEATYKSLKRIFCQKRDKADTDKAIYRLCCIGLVEDVTIDYLSETYELKIHKQTDDEFKAHMFDFFRKYYSSEQAQKRVDEINSQDGRNYLDKCLGYLTKFVYQNLEKKRYRAIEDMRIACKDSVLKRAESGNDNWLKEFIHLYFNSKYAREGYTVEDKPYSLTYDTDDQGRDDFDIVKKYIDIMNKDSSGSEVDNVKHLYGATLLSLRAHPDNAALQLLFTYCVTFLGVGTNDTLRTDAIKNFHEGFMSLSKKGGMDVWDCIDEYTAMIKPKVHDQQLEESIVNQGKDSILLFIHEEKLNEIANKYLN